MVSRNILTLVGHCLCGACRFELIGDHNWVGHCHCESCRRATSSPMTTWIGHENGRWKFTGVEPVRYESSSGNTRGFCGSCGSPIYYRSDIFPKETHFYATLLSDPNVLEPECHYYTKERLSWLHFSDGLPER